MYTSTLCIKFKQYLKHSSHTILNHIDLSIVCEFTIIQSQNTIPCLLLLYNDIKNINCQGYYIIPIIKDKLHKSKLQCNKKNSKPFFCSKLKHFNTYYFYKAIDLNVLLH